MRARFLSTTLAAVFALIFATASCDAPVVAVPDQLESSLHASVHAEIAQDDLLKSVRRATARFHSPVQALRAGYVPSGHCVAHPDLGGMGDHWANEGLVGVDFDPLRPPVLLYAPGRRGQPQLVAVEYVVIDIGQDRPHFGDQPFDVGGTPIPAPHWSLHVWLYEANPEGMFEPYNPNVSC
jgi:hypothetical protein